jgi:hypothetical protein
MCGAMPPLPNTPSWLGAQFKKAQGLLYFTLLYFTLNMIYLPVYPCYVGPRIEVVANSGYGV